MEPKLIGLILNFLMIPSIIGAPIGASVFPLLVDNVDPTYFWFRDISFFSNHRRLTIILRVVIIYLTFLHGNVILNVTVITCGNIALMFYACLETLTRCGRNHKFGTKLHTYRQLQILMTITNHTLQHLMAFGLLVAFIGFVIMGYVVVKLFHVMPIAMTLFLSVISVLCFVAIVDTMLPIAIRGTLLSGEFIRKWGMQSLRRWERKELKSCRILRLRVGSYTTLTKGFLTNFVARTFYDTVNLIIFVWIDKFCRYFAYTYYGYVRMYICISSFGNWSHT